MVDLVSLGQNPFAKFLRHPKIMADAIVWFHQTLQTCVQAPGKFDEKFATDFVKCSWMTSLRDSQAEPLLSNPFTHQSPFNAEYIFLAASAALVPNRNW